MATHCTCSDAADPRARNQRSPNVGFGASKYPMDCESKKMLSKVTKKWINVWKTTGMVTSNTLILEIIGMIPNYT